MFRLFQILFGLIGAVLAALGGLIAFGTREAPPEMTAITQPYRGVDFSGLPALETLPALRGGPIAFRRYGIGSAQAVILLHGSAGHGTSLHPLARAMAEVGISVFVPDIRGHGATGERGTISFDSQLADDIHSLVLHVRDLLPKVQVTLAGVSAGGGLALKFAGGAEGDSIDRLVMIGPALDRNAPTMTGDRVRRWAEPFTPRIVALEMLNSLGVRLFNHLPVIAYAIPREPVDPPLTGTYSYRLLKAMLPEDHAAHLRGLVRPAFLVLGANDELFDAATLRTTVLAARRDVSVTLVPGVTHVGLVLAPPAQLAVIEAVLGRSVESRPGPPMDDSGAAAEEAAKQGRP